MYSVTLIPVVLVRPIKHTDTPGYVTVSRSGGQVSLCQGDPDTNPALSGRSPHPVTRTECTLPYLDGLPPPVTRTECTPTYLDGLPPPVTRTECTTTYRDGLTPPPPCDTHRVHPNLSGRSHPPPPPCDTHRVHPALSGRSHPPPPVTPTECTPTYLDGLTPPPPCDTHRGHPALSGRSHPPPTL